MDPFEESTQAFIIRFWLEPREIEGAQSFWRGMIEHIPTGERRYFHRIDEIPKIIRPFLKVPGTDLGQRKSIWQWLKQTLVLRDKKSR